MYQRLFHEATERGAEHLLERLPADQRAALTPLVYQAVGDAVRYYAEGLEKVTRQLHPLDRARSR